MMRDTELTGLAMTLGRDSKMTITVGGEQSYCTSDGSYINIAKMPLTPQGRLLTCGLIFHELGHKHHTTGQRPPGLLGELTNVIEDVRTEALTIKERPGTGFDLEAVTRYYLKGGALQPKNTAAALLGLTLVRGRILCLRQQGLETYDQKYRKALVDTFEENFASRIETILEQEFTRLVSTDDAREMAQRLLDELRDQAQDKKPGHTEEQENEGDSSSEGKNNMKEDFSESSEDEKSDSQAQENSQRHDAEKSDLQEKPATETGKESSSDFGDQGEQDNKELSSRTEKIEALIAEGTGFEELSAFLTRELDTLAIGLNEQEREALPELPEIARRQVGCEPLDETCAIAASSRMRARLLTLLQATRNPPQSFGRLGRKLDTKRLVRMAKGDPRLFKKRIEVQAPNTAVMILLDGSGSMAQISGVMNRAEIANRSAFALHHALFSLSGISVASALFTNPFTGEPLVNLLAGFGEKPQSAAFNIAPGGGTPTHSALWAARALLLQRREPRRILLILTDGYPSDPDKVIAATGRCVRDGIEIAALGIETDAVRDYWENHRVIDCLEDLPAKIFGVMEALLTVRVYPAKK